MADTLDGKVVVVTGGARGQGAAEVEALARAGATVVATDVLDEEGATLAKTLAADGLDVEYAHLDVTDPDGWTALADRLRAGHGRVDGLVNNAGRRRPRAAAERVRSTPGTGPSTSTSPARCSASRRWCR